MVEMVEVVELLFWRKRRSEKKISYKCKVEKLRVSFERNDLDHTPNDLDHTPRESVEKTPQICVFEGFLRLVVCLDV